MNKMKDSNKVYGQTISFRYFADKRLKPSPYFKQGKIFDSYPLYIEIKTKRQTSQRKSALGSYVVPELIEQFLQDNANAIEVEVSALREHILAQNPFESANFSLSQSLLGYSALQEHMPYLIGGLLRYDYKEAREDDAVALMKLDTEYYVPELRSPLLDIDIQERDNMLSRRARDVFYRGKYDDIIDPIAVFSEVRDLAVSCKPNVKALYERYGKHLWCIDLYFQFISENTRFKLVTTSIFLSQDFKETFIKCFTKDHSQPVKMGEEIYNSIVEGLRQLKTDKPDEKKLISVKV